MKQMGLNSVCSWHNHTEGNMATDFKRLTSLGGYFSPTIATSWDPEYSQEKTSDNRAASDSLPGLPFKAQVRSGSEKAMAIHSSTLAWKTPWTQGPGRLQSMESWRVRHDGTTSLSLFTFMHWRRKWQPTRVFLPGESQGRQSLVGCCLWGRTELDTTEVT